MTNVPDPLPGSVDSYAQIMRRIVRDPSRPEAAAIGLVQYILGDSLCSAEEKVLRIGNVVAAVSLLDEPADPTGLAYSREADDPTPVSPARVPLHTGGVTEAGLVDETEVSHEAIGGSVGGPGENSAECDCGTVFDGFDTAAEANEQLQLHIEAATSPTGLTLAADRSRGVLAGTSPVVTYFSFGHGQTDPDSGKNLLNHYVTVVAPTYEACREAMFASRFGRAWSFDYLAGTARATEWIPRWTEHEVIVTPDTDASAAAPALEAARQLLDGEDPF